MIIKEYKRSNNKIKRVINPDFVSRSLYQYIIKFMSNNYTNFIIKVLFNTIYYFSINYIYLSFFSL